MKEHWDDLYLYLCICQGGEIDEYLKSKVDDGLNTCGIINVEIPSLFFNAN